MSGRQLGNYRIIDYIGSGGFGSVFRAEDINTPGRIVAVKELHKKHTRSAVIKQRFFHEALAMARLDHPSLPRLYTFGEDNGSYYLVMELLSGQLLSDELQEKESLDPARAAAILSQALDALSYAHRNGIIHRDLKPDNIMLVEDGDSFQVKVLDFGIARMVWGENLTMTGQGIGTPAYMSPERIKGEAGIDHRTDIYSAGILLFEMLTGYAPFASKASDPAVYWAEMRALHESQPLPPLSAQGIPAELERIVSKATSKRIEDRYATAEDMLADLSRISDKRVSDALEPRSSRLMIVTAPASAEVFIDNLSRGTSDSETGRILIENLTPEVHEVRVSKNGYNDYKINVSLEEGRKTDLQVTLAARATMSVDEAETERLDSGNEVATALITVEGLPTGSAVYVNSQPVAVAGEDGRATVRLDPGHHEVQAATPSGDAIRKYITVQESDAGSIHTMTFPLGSGTTIGQVADVTQVIAQPAAPSEESKTGRRVAAAVAVILLLALAATAFFVLRGPSPEIVQSDADTAQSVQAQPLTASTEADQKKALQDTTKVQEDAAAIAEEQKEIEAEKRRLEAERKKLEADKKAADEDGGVTSAPEPAAVPDVAPSPATSEPSAAPDSTTCIVVSITGPVGQTAPAGTRVVVAEEPESSRPTVHRGHTNASGQWSVCGLTPGTRVRVAAFGRRGALLATRHMTIARGRNSISLQVNKLPARSFGPDESESTRLRRRPPEMRRP